ncbi:MAG: hypothetical protein AAF743_15340 [Planctomycetota bacterium]
MARRPCVFRQCLTFAAFLAAVVLVLHGGARVVHEQTAHGSAVEVADACPGHHPSGQTPCGGTDGEGDDADCTTCQLIAATAQAELPPAPVVVAQITLRPETVTRDGRILFTTRPITPADARGPPTL